jgi:beta-glucosidase
LISPSVAISAQARLDGTTVTTTTSDTDASAAAGKSAAIVFITADSGEEYITVEGNMGGEPYL